MTRADLTKCAETCDEHGGRVGEIWAESIFLQSVISGIIEGMKLTHELHLPLPHALHLYSVEVWQVVVLVPQGVFLQAEGGEASRSIPTRENAVRTIWGGNTQTSGLEKILSSSWNLWLHCPEKHHQIDSMWIKAFQSNNKLTRSD